MSKVLYIDTETTGLDPVKNDVVQVSGIIEIDGVVAEEFDILMQPFDYTTVKQEALDVQGRTIAEIKTYQSPKEGYQKLLRIFGKHIDKYNKFDKLVPVGQNVRFDLDFMREFFAKNNDVYFGSWVDSYCPIDLLALVSFLQFAGLFKLKNQKLETVAAFFGHQYNAHSAIDDIRMTRTIIKDLVTRFIKTKKEK